MSFNTSNGTLAGTPGYNHAGIYYDIAIKVSDGVNSASLNAFSISVQDSNRPPSINGTPATSVAEGAAYDFTPSAADADGDTLSFSISNRPSWASFNTSSGSLNGTPSFNDAGTYSNIKISVSDGTASTSLNPFSIYVSENNQTPRISGTPSTHGKEGQDYSFTPSATDADGDTLSFSVANLPAWAIFSNTDGTVSGTPGYSDAGNYHNIIISVSDGSATASLNAYSISVQDSNRVSSISGIPTTSVAEGEAYAFTPSASDPDGDTLTFNISNLPNWASFDTTSGSLTGTPGFNDAGIFSNIVISVSDGYDSVMLDPFNITVIDTKEDTIPELSPGAPILTSANVSDTSILLAWKQDHAIPDGGYDIFIDSVDTNTQYRTNQLSATIPEIDTAVSHCFAIKARYTDTSQFLVSNELCTDAIAPDNEAPIISGNPPKSVTADEIYNFTPTASDPDGDNLKFAVINLPGWMSFYVGNGTISGTPTGDDIGIYEDIIITVSDGTASSSLDAMSITVNPAPDIKGSANLTWHIPTTRTDGSLLNLSEINGFRIYRGDTKETLNMVLDLNNSSTKSHTVTDLTPGTHYFAVTVYDTQDNESDFSNIAKKTVP
jgi:hypothetical protein